MSEELSESTRLAEDVAEGALGDGKSQQVGVDLEVIYKQVADDYMD
jgi:hypothetical protein